MKDHGSDKLEEARQQLVEANQHIAQAVEQIATHEIATGTLPDEDRISDVSKELLHRRRDGLAVVFSRLQTIQEDLRRVGRTARLFRRERQPPAPRDGAAGADDQFTPKQRVAGGR